MTISLSELKAMRAEMTPGSLRTKGSDPDSCGELLIVSDYCIVCHMPDEEDAEDNADGIVATHNAADVLIEIAEAELACREASDALARFGDGDAYGKAILAGDVASAQTRLTTALAKVKP